MWEAVHQNALVIFVVTTMTYAAGICFIYSPNVSTRVGGVLLSAASLIVGYNLLGFGISLIVLSLAIVFFCPPQWARSAPVDEKKDASSAPWPDAERGRVVELCSAADEVAAYALRDMLQEAGIPAEVVGELLGNAAGGLPLGETIGPRIWVREPDLARAQPIVQEWAKKITPS